MDIPLPAFLVHVLPSTHVLVAIADLQTLATALRKSLTPARSENLEIGIAIDVKNIWAEVFMLETMVLLANNGLRFVNVHDHSEEA